MAIPYSLAVKLVRPGQPELGNKTFAVAQQARVLDLSDMAEHMSSHDSKYNKGDVMAVLTQLAQCLREQLLLGNKVVLGDMGAFYVTLTGEGADNAETYTTALIKRVGVRWEPSTPLKDLVSVAQFRFVGSRDAQIAARKADKERLNDLATKKPGTDTPDENPDGGGDFGQ